MFLTCLFWSMMILFRVLCTCVSMHIAGQCDSTRSRSHCQSSDPPCSVSTRGQGFSVCLNCFSSFLSCFGGIYSSFIWFLWSLKVFGNLGKQSCLFLDPEKKRGKTETRVAVYVFNFLNFFHRLSLSGLDQVPESLWKINCSTEVFESVWILTSVKLTSQWLSDWLWI